MRCKPWRRSPPGATISTVRDSVASPAAAPAGGVAERGAIDGVDWIADPGSYLYTASRALRNAYRSVAAHWAPRWAEREPGRLDLGDFWLGDAAQASCLRFDRSGFSGEHRGFGTPVRRDLAIGADTITIRDSGMPIDPREAEICCVGRDAFIRCFPPAVPFSPGYGKRHRHKG